MAKRAAPEVNAGSMADIAFLLLIFFLVTTTIERDEGILRSLPPDEENIDDPPKIKERNLFTVLLNRNDQLLVEDKEIEIGELRQQAIDFLDNGGATNAKGESCTYCKGKADPDSSDHPEKAIISLTNDRETTYGRYIEVQNEIVAAYNFLREREAKRLYGKDYPDAELVFAAMLEEKSLWKPGETDEILEAKIKTIKDLFPIKFSEAEPRD